VLVIRGKYDIPSGGLSQRSDCFGLTAEVCYLFTYVGNRCFAGIGLENLTYGSGAVERILAELAHP
jgi:hypothetical protein